MIVSQNLKNVLAIYSIIVYHAYAETGTAESIEI